MLAQDTPVEIDVQQPNITEADESQEQTIALRAREQHTQQHNGLSSAGFKRQLVAKFFSVDSEDQRKQLLEQWPNPAVRKLLEQGIIEIKNQVYMVGSVVNNMIHGYALVLYNPTRFYQGHFQNNMKHGMGTEYLSNGVYSGQYINNKPDGKGSFHWCNGEVYEGDFLGGLKHGQGRWTSKEQSYVGEWRANKPDGYGIIVTDESRYQGEVRSGLKHGQGKQLFTNGDKYSGGYVNGRPEGIGQYTWAKSVSCYRGTFKNGLRHGNGVWVQGGDRYEGHYLNDRKNGKGKFIWASGNVYTGCYFDDVRHGFGQMRWADGSWYKGEWKYGVQHGFGEMGERGQQPRRGLFEDNTLVNEEDNGKKLKMQKIHTRRIDKLAQPPKAAEDKHCHRLITLPEMQESNMHKRLPRFSMPRVNKQVEAYPKPLSTAKHGKHDSERTVSRGGGSNDSKQLRNSNLRHSQSNDNRVLRRSKHGEIVRNSSRDKRDDTSNIIQWSSAHQHIEPLHKTTKIGLQL